MSPWLHLRAEGKPLQGSEGISSLFYPEAFVKQGCLGPPPLHRSSLINSLPEKSQGLAQAATCLAERKCQQEKIKRKKSKAMGDGAADLLQAPYQIN